MVDLISRLRGKIDVNTLIAYGNTQWLVDYAVARGVTSEVICPKWRPARLGGAGGRLGRLFRTAGNIPPHLLLLYRLRRRLKKLPPDMIWVNNARGLTIASQASRGLNIPIVLHARTAYEPATISNTKARRLRNNVALYLCLSDLIADSLVELGIDRQLVHVVPNAIDAERLRADTAELPAVDLPGGGHAIRILLPGTVSTAKGVDVAVRALAKLVTRGVDAVLYLTGDPSQPSVTEALRLAEKEGVVDKVFAIGWRKDIARVMQAATVIVLPSLVEGVPRVLMEAMALQRPVVATPVGGVRDLIEHEKTGWLHKINDDSGLAQCILDAHDPLKREYVVRAAYDHICSNFSPSRQVEMACDAFRQLLSKCETR